MLAPPNVETMASSRAVPRPDLLVRWLTLVAALVVAMVIVGGITRLTESGLSITEWRPISGAVPPLTSAQWEEAFALYRQTTEYQAVNRGMSMADFQFIFFWEWAHRLLGRLIGLAFALPLAWFAWKRMIPPGYGWRLVALLALGALQGAVGWWMVKSGLVGRTDVSHYRLATHLGLALFILGGLVWTARDLAALAQGRAARPARLTGGAVLVLAALAIQIVLGAFTAGLNAGYAFPTWPLMGDEWFPTGTVMLSPWFANLVDNPVVVQFVHRWWAFAAAAGLIWLGIAAMRAGDRRGGSVLHGLVLIQISLGIATLVSGVALWIAVAHQGMAALLVAASLWCAHSVALGARDSR